MDNSQLTRNGLRRGANGTSHGPGSGARTAGHNMQVGGMWAVACQLFMDLTQEPFLLEDRDWRSVTEIRGGDTCEVAVKKFESMLTKMHLDSYDKPTQQRVDSIWPNVSARPSASPAPGVPVSEYTERVVMLRKKMLWLLLN